MLSRNQQIAIGASVVAVAAAIAISLLVVKTKENFVSSPHTRVVTVVKAWSHVSDPPKDTDLLEAMWDHSGPSFEFYPYGAQDLEARLLKAFPESKKPVVRYTDLYATKNPSAKVKTVFDLSELVRYNYQPQ